MSTKQKNKSATGVRYSPAQKQEVLDFVAQYNSSHGGRGGQSAASMKFGVTPLTISGWLKSGGSSSAAKSSAKVAKKAAGKAVSTKATKVGRGVQVPAKGRANRGMRYSPDHKQEVIDFVASYNAKNGRGGQRHAAKKFNVSVLTVANWLKAAGKKGARGAKVSSAKVTKSTRGGDPAEELRALKAAIRALIG